MFKMYTGEPQLELTCTATYAIDRGVTDLSPHNEALLDRVAVVSVLARLEGRGPLPSEVSISISSAADDGEVKIALYA